VQPGRADGPRGGRRDRQATLRAVFDWSWDLLSLPEKAALAQLSVFEGGFTLESVEAVLDLSAYENAPWPMDALQSLVQKSLVRQVTDNRFDLLVSVQEYAAEQLRTAARYPGSGPVAPLAAEMRHGAHFASLDEKAAVADAAPSSTISSGPAAEGRARGRRRWGRVLAGRLGGGGARPLPERGRLASSVRAIPGIPSRCAHGGLRCWTCAGYSGKSTRARSVRGVTGRSPRVGDRRCEGS
jgi:hypothetical protein